MTEQEKMLEMLRMMAQGAKEDRLTQLMETSKMVKEFYDSYVAVGFTRIEALELTKSMISAVIMGVTKK